MYAVTRQGQPSFLRVLARRNMTGIHYAHPHRADQQQGRHYSDFRASKPAQVLESPSPTGVGGLKEVIATIEGPVAGV